MSEVQRSEQPYSKSLTGSTPASPHPNGRVSEGRTIQAANFAANASIVLVGIRGCGKRSLGLIAATALGRRFITEDHFFQTTTGLSRQDYLKVHGSEEFHKHDVQVSRRMLEENRTGCIVDCGLGSLTSSLQEFLKSYSLTNPVIYIIRDMIQIMGLLKLNEHSAKRLETVDPTHRRCSNYEYFNLEDTSAEPGILESETHDRASPQYSFKLREAQSDFSRFVRSITGVTEGSSNMQSPFSLDTPFHRRLHTYALEVPFSSYCDGEVALGKLESGGDVIEIMVDRWQSASVKELSRMVADVRRQLKAPILINPACAVAKSANDVQIEILKHGLRLGVEFLVVDTTVESLQVTELLRIRGPTQFIAASKLPPETGGRSIWLNGAAADTVQRAAALGLNLIRVTHSASSREENQHVTYFRQKLQQDGRSDVSVMAYNTGQLGRTSQVFNPALTSVTHETLKHGQLATRNGSVACITSQEAIQALFSGFVLDSLDFCIIGGNVSQSLSPAMHNAAYRHIGLKHNYTTHNIKSWGDVESLAKNPNFGGASIVQPWKVRLATKVAHLSEHARIIGAINTLIPLRSRADGSILSLHEQAAQRNRAGPVAAWYGDNTDWLAMYVCISRSLSPRNVVHQKSTALVVGAGGMARSATYALLQLGLRNIFIYNRTTRNGEILADHFNGWLTSRNISNGSNTSTVRILDDHKKPWPFEFIQPTIVVSCVTHEHLDGQPDSNFTMPDAWLGSVSGGVVLELAYMIRETPLTIQVKKYRQETGIPWVVVDGIEALFEQALAQFETMTGRPAPERCMREAINKAIQGRQTFVADGEEFEVV